MKTKDWGGERKAPSWESHLVDYNNFFLRMSGPTLSPVSSLCFKCDLSQTGNYNRK